MRPRRFGKSLFLSMMECYYDLNQKKNFQKLFGDLWIGRHPTKNANRFMTLKLDFSKIGGTGEELERAFEQHISDALEAFVNRYPICYDANFISDFKNRPIDSKFASTIYEAREKDIPVYLFIDEYDNFTNQMIRATGVKDYRDITHGAGFYRNWFKKFKGDFDRILMMGVSPVTMDDLTSGFNIAANLTLEPDFNAALGFSEAEVLKMYTDFKGTGRFTRGEPAEIVSSIRPWYDGYCFAEQKVGRECVFNSDMTLYHLKHLVHTGEPPRNMVDANVRTDYEKLKTIADLQRTVLRLEPQDALPMTEQAVVAGGVQFPLVDSFPAEAIIKPANFHSLFFYYGLLSMTGRRMGATVFGVPNACVEMQIFSFLREMYFPPTKDWLEWDSAARAFAYQGAWREFLSLVAKNFEETTPIRGGIGGEVRLQGYFQCEMRHLPQFIVCPELELAHGNCDFFLFPERTYYADVPHSYIVEFKHARKGTKKTELDAQRAEGLRQLATYAKDRKVPVLAKGTTLHLILVQYRGSTMVNCELVDEKAY
ncbi:MAG: AAA family ATPase [Victivallales bacterium]|nr:AAA family ATPase [Victivallales bacterium]